MIGENPYRIYVAPLNRNTTFEPAYQVSAFSLTTLESDLAELRLRGKRSGCLCDSFSGWALPIFSPAASQSRSGN